MDSPEPARAPQGTPASRGGLIVMAAFLVALALLAIYSNVEKARRSQIETVTITAASSPTPSPAAP